MATKLKAMNIKGKQYVTVAERVRGFNADFPSGRINTEVTFEGEYIRCRATVWPEADKPERFFTGHAEEKRGGTGVNATSAVENCETGAVGRALGMMGIGIIDGFASADEVVGAEKKKEFILSAESALKVPEWNPKAANWFDVKMVGTKDEGASLGNMGAQKIKWYAESWNPRTPEQALVKAAIVYGYRVSKGEIKEDVPFV